MRVAPEVPEDVLDAAKRAFRVHDPARLGESNHEPIERLRIFELARRLEQAIAL